LQSVGAVLPFLLIMKIPAVALALCLFAQSASALTLSDLIGTWTGTRTKTTKGEKSSGPATFSFKKFQNNGGIIEHSTSKTPGGSKIRGTRKYYPYANYYGGGYSKTSGSVEFFSSNKGDVAGLSSGYYSIHNTTLRIRQSSNLNNKSSQTTIRFLNKDTFILATRLDDGSTVTGRFERR
jgi:hypothetical protein